MKDLSERAKVASRIAEKIIEWRLTMLFGGDVEKSGQYYGILFARPRNLDGLVRVYSSKFILIESAGPLGRGKLVFESEANALAYLEAAFIKFDFEKADTIPVKPAKKRAA